MSEAESVNRKVRDELRDPGPRGKSHRPAGHCKDFGSFSGWNGTTGASREAA